MQERSGESRRAVLAAIRAAASAGCYETGAEIAIREGIWICVVCVKCSPRVFTQRTSEPPVLVCDECRYKISYERRMALRAPELPAWWREKQRRGEEKRKLYEQQYGKPSRSR